MEVWNGLILVILIDPDWALKQLNGRIENEIQV